MDLVLGPNTVVGQTVDIRIRKFQGNLRVAGVGDVFELSDTAAFIFRKVNGSRTVEEISAEVANHYDAQPDEVRDDVRELLTELVKNKVLEVVVPG
ncbi:PqqD family protein [Streptosporangium sp. NPDC049376]|uniref:PqqD family protein n=1 Tax=Streptosporangium sp. NPDC049376 TaxID=3366192 RepID=UPI0037AB1BDF